VCSSDLPIFPAPSTARRFFPSVSVNLVS